MDVLNKDETISCPMIFTSSLFECLTRNRNNDPLHKSSRRNFLLFISVRVNINNKTVDIIIYFLIEQSFVVSREARQIIPIYGRRFNKLALQLALFSFIELKPETPAINQLLNAHK